jgi:tyrosine-protein kinase Etk/Wzc
MSDHIQENNELDINLLDILIALGQEKWILIVVTFSAALLGVVVSLITPAIYVSRTSIMHSQQSVGAGSLGALAGVSGLVGLSGLSGMASNIKSSDEMLIALMRSYSVQSSLIDQFKLKERYGARNMEEARQFLSKNVVVIADKKSGLLSIDAHDKDPEFAVQLANAQVKELNVILSRIAVTEAQQRRAFYQKQIVYSQTKIPKLEFEFKEAQKNSGLEVASLLSEVGTLPGQIAAKELQLQVLSRFATGQNPDLKRLAVEISALRAQMAQYDLNKPSQASENFRSNFVQKATQAYNTLKIQELLLEGYVKQLELAKVDEAKEGPVVQVVDEANTPEIRAKPERKKMVIAYMVTGLVIAFVLAAFRALMRHIRSSPGGGQRWSQLKRAWGFD